MRDEDAADVGAGVAGRVFVALGGGSGFTGGVLRRDWVGARGASVFGIGRGVSGAKTTGSGKGVGGISPARTIGSSLKATVRLPSTMMMAVMPIKKPEMI